ncbi:MAG: hypothetical protein J6V07_02350, partial [Clostridia bacterium]|nr:hypothetical protein [Clostridia bacterium]
MVFERARGKERTEARREARAEGRWTLGRRGRLSRRPWSHRGSGGGRTVSGKWQATATVVERVVARSVVEGRLGRPHGEGRWALGRHGWLPRRLWNHRGS